MLPRPSVALLLAAGLCAAAAPLRAATGIAAEPGLSGFLSLGVGAARASTNQVAIDSGNDTIDNLEDSPDSASTTIPAVSLSLTYTFENGNTEVFLGDSVEDFVRFDFATVAGLRHRSGDTGIFEVAAVRTPFAREVWADPYLAGEEREETDREVDGFRLQWGKMLQSGFDLRITRREADINDEESGAALLAASLITADEQHLLDRNGDINSTRLTYNWPYGRGESVSLSLEYLDFDLDGEAMAFDGYAVHLSNLAALNPRVRLSTNVILGDYRHDTENPLYGENNDKALAALTLTLFVSGPFGIRDWIGSATLAYARENNAIDFYDTEAGYASFSLIRRF